MTSRDQTAIQSNVPKSMADRPVRVLVICSILTVIITGIYLNSFKNNFTNWDDGMIYQSSIIRDLNWNTIQKIFTYQRASTYQPIRTLSYAVDYRFWKLNPMGYRITNIFFYILTCITIFFVIRRLSADLRENASSDDHERVALLGSLLFAVHPVHVEAVTWLAARKEVLQGFFFFLAFYLYLKGGEGKGTIRVTYLGLVLLSILFAILSKPSAVVFPGVLLVYEIARRRNGWFEFIRKYWIFFLLSAVLSLIFILILLKVMVDAGGIKPYRGGSSFGNLLVSFYVLLHNIKLLIATINYSAAYTISVPNPILVFRTLAFVGVTFLLFCFSLWSLKKAKVIFFSFFFFLITLFPYLNLVPISTLLADRYVFIASFSSCFLMGIGFNELCGIRIKGFSGNFFKVLSTTFFLFVICGYAFMTVRQNEVWENSYTLWADAVEKTPDSNTANALMGVVYMDLGMDREALPYLEKAVRLIPYDYQSRNNLGIVYGRLEQPERALEELMAAIWLKPDDDSIKINLSLFYQRQKEYKKSEEILKYLLSKNPGNAHLHFRLGLLYKEARQYKAAVSQLERAAELAPHIINSYEELGNIYASQFKDLEKAKYYYSMGVEAAPAAKSRVPDLRWMIQDLER